MHKSFIIRDAMNVGFINLDIWIIGTTTNLVISIVILLTQAGGQVLANVPKVVWFCAEHPLRTA